MGALNFLKFWKPTTSKPNSLTFTESEVSDEEEDSLFELELSLSDFDNKETKINYPDSKITKQIIPSSPKESISIRKIMPLEPISNPHSPKFRVFSKKSDSLTIKETEKTQSNGVFMETQKQKNQLGSFFTVKLDSTNSSMSTKERNLKRISKKLEILNSKDLKTEKAPKEVVNKYLKLIKPLCTKASKRYSDKVVANELSMGSPAACPASVLSISSPRGNIPSALRVVCKHLGKSKSAPVNLMTVAVNRRDDSLLQQNDGIQSAILHCKKSFNSSKGIII